MSEIDASVTDLPSLSGTLTASTPSFIVNGCVPLGTLTKYVEPLSESTAPGIVLMYCSSAGVITLGDSFSSVSRSGLSCTWIFSCGPRITRSKRVSPFVPPHLMSLSVKISQAASAIACVSTAKNTPRTRLRNTKKPMTPATAPGINTPRISVLHKLQNGFQNHGTSASEGCSPTLYG